MSFVKSKYNEAFGEELLLEIKNFNEYYMNGKNLAKAYHDTTKKSLE